jgi:hypothetical protein
MEPALSGVEVRMPQAALISNDDVAESKLSIPSVKARAPFALFFRVGAHIADADSIQELSFVARAFAHFLACPLIEAWQGIVDSVSSVETKTTLRRPTILCPKSDELPQR